MEHENSMLLKINH